MAGKRYAFLAETSHSLAELTEYPMISMPEGASTKQYISMLFEANGLEFKPDIEVTTIELAMQAVERNLGIGTLPLSEAQSKMEAGTMFRIPVTVPPLMRKAYVISSKTIPLSSAAQIYLDDYLFWGEKEKD